MKKLFHSFSLSSTHASNGKRNWRRFSLSPSEGERAGVRGPFFGFWGLSPLFLLSVLLASTPLARSQNGIGDIVYTVGTVTRDSSGQDWAYLLWQATQPELTSGRVFAIYSKPGDAASASAYTRVSLVRLQTDFRIIEPLLRRAARLGDDLDKLSQDLRQLFVTVVPSSSISLADELSAVIRGSLNVTDYYQNLVLLSPPPSRSASMTPPPARTSRSLAASPFRPAIRPCCRPRARRCWCRGPAPRGI
jgi:hypothetical protein